MRVRRHLLALPIAVLLSAGLVAPATATGSGWEPVPDDPDDTVAACGTTLTVSEKVNEVETRAVPLANGATRTDFRGRYVVSVSAPDGRKAVLDNSGPYSVTEYASGDLFVDIGAPSLIYYFDAVEKAAFARAGLPPVFYYRSGRLKLSIGDGTERVVARPKSVTSICHLLRR
jgi:hypothetical protein